MNSQKGFSAVEGLLVVFVLALVGLGGWYAWSRNSNRTQQTETVQNSTSNDSVSNSQTAANKPEGEEPTESYKGEPHTSSMGGFSMNVLNGWIVESDTTYDYLFQYSPAKLAYDEKMKPVVTETSSSGVGGYVSGIMISMSTTNIAVENGEPFALKDGTEGLCETTVSTKADDALGLMRDNAGNFINKRCSFTKNGHTVAASYSYYEKEPLDAAAVEYAFKSIIILK